MSKCENCINYEACERFGENIFGNHYEYKVEEICHYFKDKSLFVELPCKVGDTVYLLTGSTTPIEAFVSSIEFFYNWIGQSIENHFNLRIYGNFPVHKRLEDFGKTVFLTKEDAERKLKEVGE